MEQLRKDEAIAEADTLLLTVPNQLGVAYNAHVIEAILTHARARPRLALTPGPDTRPQIRMGPWRSEGTRNAAGGRGTWGAPRDFTVICAAPRPWVME